MAVMAQFPLGTVLFPTMVLPLHVFELRYRALVKAVMDGDGTFGVVLIERGSEVGGEDQRTDFGTMAKVIESEQLSDGRWALVTVGIERFKVNRWLADNPYPMAEVEPWPDAPVAEGIDHETTYRRIVAKFQRCMALAAESGVNIGPLPEAVDDLELGSMQMAALAPVASLDKQYLLGAAGPSERLTMLDGMLDDALELIRMRLTGT